MYVMHAEKFTTKIYVNRRTDVRMVGLVLLLFNGIETSKQEEDATQNPFHDSTEFSDDIMSRHVLSESLLMMKFSSIHFN